MERTYITLKKFCTSAGISILAVRMLLHREEQSGIAKSGALLRLGGRWYVDPDKMTEYMRDSAQRWASRQPGPSPRRREIKPPRAKVGA